MKQYTAKNIYEELCGIKLLHQWIRPNQMCKTDPLVPFLVFRPLVLLNIVEPQCQGRLKN